MHRVEITVKGETATGKTIVLAAIERAIKELGVRMILSPELESERNMGNPDNPPDWEMESLRKNTYIVLNEVNIPRK